MIWSEIWTENLEWDLNLQQHMNWSDIFSDMVWSKIWSDNFWSEIWREITILSYIWYGVRSKERISRVRFKVRSQSSVIYDLELDLKLYDLAWDLEWDDKLQLHMIWSDIWSEMIWGEIWSVMIWIEIWWEITIFSYILFGVRSEVIWSEVRSKVRSQSLMTHDLSLVRALPSQSSHLVRALTLTLDSH